MQRLIELILRSKEVLKVEIGIIEPEPNEMKRTSAIWLYFIRLTVCLCFGVLVSGMFYLNLPALLPANQLKVIFVIWILVAFVFFKRHLVVSRVRLSALLLTIAIGGALVLFVSAFLLEPCNRESDMLFSAPSWVVRGSIGIISIAITLAYLLRMNFVLQTTILIVGGYFSSLVISIILDVTNKGFMFGCVCLVGLKYGATFNQLMILLGIVIILCFASARLLCANKKQSA